MREAKSDMNPRFQMVSLLKLATVTEEGVRFLSPHDGTPMYKAPPLFHPQILKDIPNNCELGCSLRNTLSPCRTR